MQFVSEKTENNVKYKEDVPIKTSFNVYTPRSVLWPFCNKVFIFRNKSSVEAMFVCNCILSHVRPKLAQEVSNV